MAWETDPDTGLLTDTETGNWVPRDLIEAGPGQFYSTSLGTVSGADLERLFPGLRFLAGPSTSTNAGMAIPYQVANQAATGQLGMDTEQIFPWLQQAGQQAGLPQDFDWMPYMVQAAQQSVNQFGSGFTPASNPVAVYNQVITAASASNPNLAQFVASPEQVAQGAAFAVQRGDYYREMNEDTNPLRSLGVTDDFFGPASVMAPFFLGGGLSEIGAAGSGTAVPEALGSGISSSTGLPTPGLVNAAPSPAPGEFLGTGLTPGASSGLTLGNQLGQFASVGGMAPGVFDPAALGAGGATIGGTTAGLAPTAGITPGVGAGTAAGAAGAAAGAGPAAGAGLGAAAPALTNAGLGAAGLGALLAGVGANQGASDITTRVAPWEPAVPFLQGSMQQAQAFGGSPLPYGSPSEMVAGLTSDQLAAFDMIRQNAAGPQGATANAALENLQPILSGSWMDVNRNPYLQGAIQAAVRPVQEQYLETVLPSIRTAYNTGDDFNNSRRGIAEGIAARGYMQRVGDIGSQLANRAYETGQGATASMFGQTPALLQAAQLPAQGVLGVGQQLQQQQQQQANARQAFDQLQLGRIQAPFNIYNAAAAGGRQQTQPAPQTNPWMAAIGGGLAGAQIYNMLGGG